MAKKKRRRGPRGPNVATQATTQEAQFTPEQQQLMRFILPQAQATLEAAPLQTFIRERLPPGVAPLTPQQQSAIEQLADLTRRPVLQAPEISALQQLAEVPGFFDPFVAPSPLQIVPPTGGQTEAIRAIRERLGMPLISPPETEALSQLRGAPGTLDPFRVSQPLQIVPPTGGQTEAIRAITGRLTDPLLSGPEALELSEIAREVTAPIGQSPATVEGIRALERQFQEVTQPTIESQLALAGLGRSGALGESLQRARADVAAATTPLLLAEEQRRFQALPLLAELGQRLEARPEERAGAALQAEEFPRSLAQQAEQAQREEFLRRQGLASEQAQLSLATVGPLARLGQILEARPEERAGAALQAEEFPRSLAQQAEQARLQDFLRRQQIAAAQSEAALQTVQPLARFGQLLEARPAERAQQLFDIGEASRQLQQAGLQENQADFLRRQAVVEGLTGTLTRQFAQPTQQASTTVQKFPRQSARGQLFGFGK